MTGPEPDPAHFSVHPWIFRGMLNEIAGHA